MKLIDKDTLVAEIERRLNELYNLLPNASKVENGMITISEACNTGKYTALESFKDYINTLEVKEVNLEKEIKEQSDKYYSQCEKKLQEMDDNDNDLSFLSLDNFAKYFFELGLKVAQKVE